MIITFLNLYRFFFARRFLYRFHELLYNLGLRGMGVLNFESDKLSGEDYFVRNFVSKIKIGVILDVGANTGKYSKLIRYSNANVSIFAFEPHPKTYLNLVETVKDMDVKTFNLGVGISEGVLNLYDYANEDGSSHASLYRDVIEHIHHGQSVAHEVDVVSLDNFASEHNIEQVGLLKIDTEGHELEVLKGFEKHIRSGKVDLIHFEFNEMNIVSRVCFRDFWEFLPEFDFFRMLPDGLVPIKTYKPLYSEIFAYQNIVARLKINARAA